MLEDFDGDRNWGLWIGIEDWRLELDIGIGDWDWGSELGIGIEQWEHR